MDFLEMEDKILREYLASKTGYQHIQQVSFIENKNKVVFKFVYLKQENIDQGKF